MNCLITGASSGIGRELAKKMASLGYDLFLTYYKNKELCEKFQKEIQEQYSIKCFIQKCDLKEEKEIQEVIKNFQEKLGSLDILVNNAATYCDNLFLKKTKDEFLEVLEVNVVGTFLMSKYAIPIMKDHGLIINMASTDGIDTYNLYNVDYAVSKAGIIQLTKSMSLIFKNIKTIAIAPNWVRTESTLAIDEEYLQAELKRINQEKLIPVEKVVKTIIDAVQNKNIKSGEVIKIYE